MAKSIEEKIEDIAKQQLDRFGVKYHIKTDNINEEINHALTTEKSKSGGEGGNYPDIKCLIQLPQSLSYIPVMIEVKGTVGDLIKLNDDGQIANQDEKGKPIYKNIKKYAVNGAVHYSYAVARITKSYNNVIAIGFNGYNVQSQSEPITEMGVYYVSKANMYRPKKIADYTDFSFLKDDNLSALEEKLKNIFLTDAEKESQTRELEDQIENVLTDLNQDMRDKMQVSEPKDRLKLVCALIMAGLGVEGKIQPLEISDLKGLVTDEEHDGAIILRKIKIFLTEKHLPKEKLDNINSLYKGILNDVLYYRPVNGASTIKNAFIQIKEDIMPIFTMGEEVHIDFTGKLLNVLTSWIRERASDDEKNDVVLTPRYVTELMARLCKVNKDSYVWDWATGSAGFLVSAMKLMIADANKTITNEDERKLKIANIKINQLLGVEMRQDIYILAVLNMILMKDGSSHILNKNSLSEYFGKYEQGENKDNDFPADVFLLNPPYSAEGKGMVFVEKALNYMHKGRACVIIQENAGSGQGTVENQGKTRTNRNAQSICRRILRNNTLLASIHMPIDLFIGKSSVQTAIYLFEVGVPHNQDNLVTFVDFSNDGYQRMNRKKSSSKVNLRDADHVKERYAELVDIVLNRKPKTSYYTIINGLLVKDTITLHGNDWTYNQHRKIDNIPTEADFRKTIADYFCWKITTSIQCGQGLQPILEQELLGDFSKSESQALKKIQDGNVVSKNIPIGKLFSKIKVNSLQYKTKDLPSVASKEYDLPALTAGIQNQGLNNYVPRNNATILKNVISISANGANTGATFYQSKEFTVLQDAYALKWIYSDDNLTDYQYLYFVVAISKTIYGNYEWTNKASWERIKNDSIAIPVTSDGEIDWDFMQNLISAESRLAICGVIKWKDSIGNKSQKDG